VFQNLSISILKSTNYLPFYVALSFLKLKEEEFYRERGIKRKSEMRPPPVPSKPLPLKKPPTSSSSSLSAASASKKGTTNKEKEVKSSNKAPKKSNSAPDPAEVPIFFEISPAPEGSGGTTSQMVLQEMAKPFLKTSGKLKVSSFSFTL
jgi:hypothetical protein